MGKKQRFPKKRNDEIKKAKTSFFENSGLKKELKRVKEENKNLQEKLRNSTRMDPFTGLKNKVWFNEEGPRLFAREKRYGREMFVCFIDLDCFKEVNDTHGHLVGDSALLKFSNLLGRVIKRGSDVIARIGGDEFVLLLCDTDETGCNEVCEAITAEFAKVFSNLPHLGISIGVAKSSDAPNFEEFVYSADKEMYLQKKSKKLTR